MSPLLFALLAHAAYEETRRQPPGLPLRIVGDVKHGRDPAPTGRVRIWCERGGEWVRTEVVDASAVEWSRLLDNDRIEVTDGE